MGDLNLGEISGADGTSPVTLTGQEACKAWADFNGTGTPAARDSLNLSSLTDNGNGDFTLTYSSAFNAADKSFVASAGTGLSDHRNAQIDFDTAPTTTTNKVVVSSYGSTKSDGAYNTTITVGDLA
jgi:hypothetical protein